VTTLVDRRAALTTVAVVGMLYLAAAGQARLPAVAWLAALVGVLLAALAVRWPGAAVLAAVAVVIVVPIYYGRYVVGTVAVTPAVAVSLALLPVALRRLNLWRPVPLDALVGAYVVLRAASYLLNYATGLGSLAGLVLTVALPYAVFRLCLDASLVSRLTPVVVACAAGLSIVAIQERRGVPNPFFTLLTPSYQGGFLARANERLGSVRAEASFGEPISFGMFLGLALVLVTHLALSTRRSSHRAAYLVAAGLVLVGLAATQSRGAMAVAGLAVGGYLLVLARRLSVLRLAGLLTAGVVFAFSTPLAGSVSELVSSSSGDTRESRSAEYRLQILELVKQPDQFSLLGQQTEATTEQASSDLARRVGLKSLDSHYALLYLDGGLLCLVAFGGIAGLVVATALRPGLRPVERAWAMGLAATFVNLLTVALFTQESDLVWIGVGLLGVVTQRLQQEASS